MRKRISLAAATAVLAFSAATPLFARGIDCTESKLSQVESAICDSPNLLELDARMDAAYTAALKRTAQAPRLRHLQATWLKYRDERYLLMAEGDVEAMTRDQMRLLQAVAASPTPRQFGPLDPRLGKYAYWRKVELFDAESGQPRTKILNQIALLPRPDGQVQVAIDTMAANTNLCRFDEPARWRGPKLVARAVLDSDGPRTVCELVLSFTPDSVKVSPRTEVCSRYCGANASLADTFLRAPTKP